MKRTLPSGSSDWLGCATIDGLNNAADSIEGRDPPSDGALAPGVIEIGIIDDDGQIQVVVTDNGKGLPNAERDRLTEPYVTTREKGTGLGLAIVKKIMEDHDGDLSLEDSGAGGARVVLSFAAKDPNLPESEEAMEAVDPGA